MQLNVNDTFTRRTVVDNVEYFEKAVIVAITAKRVKYAYIVNDKLYTHFTISPATFAREKRDWIRV